MGDQTLVHQALEEVLFMLDEMKDEHEGLRDFARLNLSEPTLRDVNESIALYDRRVRLLLDTKAALEALINDGFPNLNPREIMPAELAELADQQATITAALKKFASNAAVGITLAPGATEPKPPLNG